MSEERSRFELKFLAARPPDMKKTPLWAGGERKNQYQSSSLSSLSTAVNASLGRETLPSWRIIYLPSFCFSSSFFLREMSPP